MFLSKENQYFTGYMPKLHSKVSNKVRSKLNCQENSEKEKIKTKCTKVLASRKKAIKNTKINI